MKIAGLFFAVAGIGILLSQDEKNDGQFKWSEKLSSLKLSASAHILSAIGEGGHDGTKRKRWIILSPECPALAGMKIEGDDNQVFIKTLKESMLNEEIGKPLVTTYQFSD